MIMLELIHQNGGRMPQGHGPIPTEDELNLSAQGTLDGAKPSAKWVAVLFSIFPFPFSIPVPFSPSHSHFSMFFYSIHKFIRNARNSYKTNITTHFYSIQNEGVLRSAI
jgi:hypothetical protein